MPFSPSYSPPTLEQMRAIVSRTLRDNGTVFGTDALNDFIIEGLSDMSGYRPVESIEALSYAPETYGGVQFLQPTILTHVWQVVASNDGDPTLVRGHIVLPYGNPGESPLQNGWDHYGGKVWLGRWLVNQLDAWHVEIGAPLSIILHGYRDRVLPVSDGDVLDMEDATDQLCLTRECRALGFQLLNNDRALYQQWLAATNNTDVSPTQLGGMLNGAISDVEKQRKRTAIYRRTPVVGPQYP